MQIDFLMKANKKIFFSILVSLLSFSFAEAQLTATISNKKDACDGLNNGSFSITIDPPGTTGPYSIFVFGLGFGQIATANTPNDGVPVNITALRADNYLISVSDADGVTPNFTTFLTISAISPDMAVVIGPTVNNTDCATPNGSIGLTLSGGTGSFSYSWTGPGAFTSASEDISGLAGGSYSVVVADNGTNCTRTPAAIVLTDPSPIIQTVSTASPQVVCPGADASISLTATQGGPVTYQPLINGVLFGTPQVSAGAPGPITFTIPSGSFGSGDVLSIQARDGACSPVLMTGSVIVNIQNLSISSAVTNNTRCLAPFNGAINITLSGTANPVTYAWTGPGGFVASTEDISNLVDGTYTITATDNVTTCQVTANIVVGNATPVINIANAVTDNTRCLAPFSGAIDITVTGSIGVPTFSWTGPNAFVSTSEDISALETGSYTVIVTDPTSGCTATSIIAVGDATPTISLSATVGADTRCVAPFDGTIDLTVTGSLGAPTFAWTGPGGFTANTEDLTALEDGTYTVLVTDPTSGCTATTNFIVNDGAPVLTITPAITDNTRCLLPFNGAIEIAMGGSAGPFTYSWTGPGGFTASTEDITALQPGSYSVTVTETASGCIVSALNLVVADNPPTLALSQTITDNTRCVAPFNGAIDLTVAGSVGPFTYSWTGPSGFTAATEDITALEPGNYNVTVTETASGCFVSGGPIAVGNTPPTLSLASTTTDNTRCVAPFNGTIDLTVNGSVGPFTYSWTGPGGFTAATEDINALQSGSYTILVTDTPTGCTVTTNIAVGNTLPVITLTNTSADNTRCVAPFDGSIDLTVAGATGPYTYSWTGPGGFTAAVEDVLTLQSGSYSVTVTDTPSGCSANAIIAVGNSTPTITLSNTNTANTNCIAPFNGTIDLTVAGSAGPFTYSWNGPGGFTAATEDLSTLQGGTYSVLVTDVPSGCTATANINVGTATPTLTLTNAVTNNSNCIAPFNGAIDLTVAGTAGPFTFAWTGPGGFTSASEDISALQSGAYSVTVTDNTSGCIANANINVGNSLPTLVVTPAITNNTRCLAPFDGAIDITVSGGVGPYTFSWTGPGGFTASTEDITLLEDGAYNVTVTDGANGCTIASAINVGDAAPVLVLTNSVNNNINCIAPFNGSIDLTVSGSAGPFTFSWTGPGGFTASTEDINSLASGAYSVTVTDTNSGCVASTNINVGDSFVTLGVTQTITNNTQCVAPFNGAIDVTISGATGPLTFAWTGPNAFVAATEDITALENGTYNLTVTDNNSGCFTTVALVVGDNRPALVLSNTTTTNTSCTAPFTGSVDLTVTGALGALSFAWTGPNGFTAATEDINAVEGGSYTVMATDVISGCTSTAVIVVPSTASPLVITTDATTDNSRCVAPFNGSISISVSGAVGPFGFSWTGPNGFTAATEDINSLEAGQYDLLVTDTNTGCTVTTSITLNDVSPTLSISGSAITDNNRCVAPFAGAVDITVAGTAGPFTFAWTGPNGFTAATEDITALEAGTYDVTITDNASGCFVTGTFVVNDTSVPVTGTASSTDNTRCIAPFNGTIDLVPGGAAGPFSYSWTGPGGFTASTEDLSNVQDGSYDVTITDVNTGCSTTVTNIVVNGVFPAISATGIITDNTKCVAPFNGAIILNVLPAGAYSFAWTGPSGFTSNSKNITSLEAGSYDVIITDLVSGCSINNNFVVGDNAPVIAVALDVMSPNGSCVAPFDGALLITASGGSGAFGFAWTGPNGFTSTAEDLSNLEDGDYDVTVTDLNLGCTVSATFNVGDNTPAITLASQTITDNTKCIAPFDGAIVIAATGTPGPYDYSWTGPNGYTGTGASIAGLESGSYTATVTDQTIGCVNTFTLAVGDATPPVIVTVDGTTANTQCQVPFDGSISISVSGTAGPFDYLWTGPNGFSGITEDITSLEDGTYQVVVTDQVLGCSATVSGIIVNDAKPTVTIVADAITANTACQAPFDGAITVSASGTAGPYDFSWTGPNGFISTGATITALESGDYTVTAQDQLLGCSNTLLVNVPDNTPTLTITTTITPNTVCAAPFNGGIDITAVAGTAGPFTFGWTGPNGFVSAAQTLAALEPGDYTVTVTDTNLGCADSYLITVPDNAPVIAATSVINPNTSCITPFTGSIDITITGTAGPYTYSWTGPGGFTSAVEDISGLAAGNYQVDVTDTGVGCSQSFTFNVPDNSTASTITLNSLTNNTSCSSPFNGAISITAGGTPGPFTIAWTGPGGFTSSLATIGGLAPGNYVVTITDDVLGCVATTNFNVLNNAVGCGGLNCGAYTVTITDVRPSCDNQDDGQIIFNVTGGSPGYVVTLTNSDGFAQALPGAGPIFTFSNLSPADYQYTIQDQAGNICTLPYSLPLQTVVTGTASAFVDAGCFGTPTGSATLTVTGGNSPFEYSIDGVIWTSFLSGQVVTDLPPNGTYNILVRDDASDVCPDEVSVTINNSVADITATFDLTASTCTGNDGAITNITASGAGGGPYEYSIDGGANFQTDNSFTGLGGGTYALIVRDQALGCEKSFAANITFPGFVGYTVTPVDADCANNGNSGSLVVRFANAGSYQVGLSPDPLVEPVLYTDYSTLDPVNDLPLTMANLARGTYYVFAKTATAQCPTRSGPFTINGVYAISFNVQSICVNTEQSLSLVDITGEPGTPYQLVIFRKFTNDIVVNEPFTLGSIPNYTLDYNDYAFLQSPGEYVIQLSQSQQTVFCPVSSLDVDYVVGRPLIAFIGETTESYPDIENGSMKIINFDGGAVPYQIRAELDLAAVPGQTFDSDFEIVQQNSNLDYEKIYDNIPAGTYTVEVQDANGCYLALTAVVPLDTDIYIPNIFTPNEDGFNDTFFIRNLPAGAELVITNRWGKQVYETSDYKNDWDGKDVGDGIYFYKLKGTEGDALTGWVEVLRGNKP